MKNKQILLAAVVAVVVVILSGYALSHARAQGSQSAPALTVDTVAARIEDRPDIIQASGPIMPWQEAIIGAEISGQRLIEILVDVGDMVEKGQILAKYNPDTIRAEEAELKAAYAKAAADRKRALTLKGTGAMSAQQVDSFVAQASISKAQLDVKSLQLRYANVTAPDDGVISSRTATLGAVGTTGQELFRLIRQNRIEWRGELTASQLSFAQIGQRVEISLPGGEKAEAVIRQISPALDAESRMGTIYADIAPGSAAKAGMYGSARIERASRKALVVPSKAIVIRDGYSYVFLINNDGDAPKAVQQKVIAGKDQQGLTEIVEGISEGDVIAVQGAGFLNDGDIVRIAPETKPVADKPAQSPAS